MGLIDSFNSWREVRRVNDDPDTGLTLLNLKRLSSMPQQPGIAGYSSSGGQFLWNWTYAGSKIDFATAVGDLRTNNLVIAATRWVARNVYDARLKVVNYDADRKEKEIENHELTKLWKRPNPYYSGRTLAAGISFDYVTKSIAYLVKVKSSAGRTVQLWYEPYQTIRPIWDERSNDFISYYQLNRDGNWDKRLEVDDVIAICDGYDPQTRRGLLSPAAAMFREWYTENQASQFTALLMKHGLVPPVVVGLGDKERPFGGDVNEFKSALVRKMSGDNAGEPMVTSDAVNVQKLGFDYSSVGLKEVRQIPVGRFCAAIGISPVSLFLDAGIANTTYNNTLNFLRQDYRGYIVPLQNLIADEFDNQLLPDFGETESRGVTWDYSKVALMQSDKVIESKNAALLYEKGIIHRGEAREAVGYEQRPEDKDIYYTAAPVDDKLEDMPEVDPQDANEQEEPTKAKRGGATALLDEGVDFWKEFAPDEAKDLIDAVPYINGKVS